MARRVFVSSLGEAFDKWMLFSGLHDRMGPGVPRMLGTSDFKIIAQKIKEVKHCHWIDLYELKGLFTLAQIGFYYL